MYHMVGEEEIKITLHLLMFYFFTFSIADYTY